MGEGVSAILSYAVGIAISPVPIIAVILMLFSSRARVNGPLFLLGWAAGLAVVSAVVYALANASDAASEDTASDTVSWLNIVLGVLLILGAARTWRKRPASGVTPEMPKWMSSIDTLIPVKSLGLGVLLSVLNPKNLILTVGAAASLAQLGLSTSDAVVSLIVFVAVASLTIAGPVGYYLVGGDSAKHALDELKTWLVENNATVMTVLFLVIGVVLVSNGLEPLTD